MFAGAPSPDLLKPETRIREALAEPSFILNETSRKALSQNGKRIAFYLRLQKHINLLHFVAASGFMALIAGILESFATWFGAILTLIAEMVAIYLPKNLDEQKISLSKDVSYVSALSAEITEIQTILLIPHTNASDKDLVNRILKAMRAVKEIATRYELDSAIGYISTYYPRQKLCEFEEKT